MCTQGKPRRAGGGDFCRSHQNRQLRKRRNRSAPRTTNSAAAEPGWPLRSRTLYMIGGRPDIGGAPLLSRPIGPGFVKRMRRHQCNGEKKDPRAGRCKSFRRGSGLPALLCHRPPLEKPIGTRARTGTDSFGSRPRFCPTTLAHDQALRPFRSGLSLWHPGLARA